MQNFNVIIRSYVDDLKNILGNDLSYVMLYGSYVRGEYKEESDIDIALFTDRKPEEFYILVNNIAEITFEYNVKYDIILSPVFQNIEIYNKMINVVPYYQSIQREGVLVG